MKTTKIFCLSVIFVFWGLTTISAQSGRKENEPSPTPSVNVLPEATVKSKNDDRKLEKVRFLISKSLSSFESELNELGKLGYRVDKAFNFGGDAEDSQSFAAVLKLEDGNTYEYAWMSSPNKNYLESRLNYYAGNGFYVVQTFGLTGCKNNDLAQIDKDASASIDSPVLRMAKGDVFLFEKKNKSAKKIRDYKVYTGKIGFGKNPSSEIQNALNEVPD